MKLQELMADELDELQEGRVLTYAGAQTDRPGTPVPRALEFRRGDYPDTSDYRMQRREARNRRALRPR